MNDMLDEALERLRGMGGEVEGGGDPNHGPMAAEALVALGRAELAPRWANEYRRRLAPLPSPRSPVTQDTWRESLGAIERLSDWTELFAREMSRSPWRDVLAAWLPRLMPAALSAGMHGLIRTSHALRALSIAETPRRVEELGAALAYWAAYHRSFSPAPRMVGALSIGEAVDRLPRSFRGRERPGMPRELVYRLDGDPELSAAVNAASMPHDPEQAISALSLAGARLYLANAARHPLIFVHTVTAPSALRSFLPYLSGEVLREAIARVFQSQAVLVAAYGEDGDRMAIEPPSVGWEEVIARAVEGGDPHAIKFVEACRKEASMNPNDVFLAAAFDWVERLHATRNASRAERRRVGIVMG